MDTALVGESGVKLWVTVGDSGGMPGEGGAMRPSAVREDPRRCPGTKLNTIRKSEERAGRGRCAVVGKEAEDGEPTGSREPSVTLGMNAIGKRVKGKE